ncbi:MAG: hypothetical protein KDI88_15800 [Gammaproteobacteria bacterium]|nr:hypothetical protein [Gammaproteobacteria bacterium]
MQVPRQIPIALALFCLYGCGDNPPPRVTAEESAGTNRYLEAVQEAEALKHTIEERNLQQQQVDQLLRERR